MPPIRVLIVDDDVAARVGLHVIMNAEPDIEVVGESASAEDSYRQVALLRPDIVLMDVQLPGEDGISATARITDGSTEAGPRDRADDLRARRLCLSVDRGRRERISPQARSCRGSHRGRPIRRERQRPAGTHPHEAADRPVRRAVPGASCIFAGAHRPRIRSPPADARGRSKQRSRPICRFRSIR